jgi:CubicO group peptidase (beta-lactamase class C family)
MKQLQALGLLGSIALATVLSTLCAAADRYANTAAVAGTEAKAALEAGASSVTVAVMADGKIVYAKAFGEIGPDKSAPADVNTQFNMGSIAKLFPAIAALQLGEQGKLDLDKPVTDYLPKFRMRDARYKKITIRTLLNHSSGMPGTNYADIIGSRKDPDYVAKTLALLRNSDLKSNPGDINVYCNDCFTVAQAVVARRSNMSFASYVNDNIFKIAGMDNSSYYFKDGNPNIATIYDPNSQTGVIPTEYVNSQGSGGVSSTAIDLCLLSRALSGGELLNPRSIREFEKNQTGPLGSSFSAGVGLGWDDVSVPEFAAKGITVLNKAGDTIFFHSQLYIAPNENLTVAASVAGPATLDPGVIEELARKALRAALDDKGVLSKTTTSPAALPQPAVIPKEVYKYEGIYGSFIHAIQKFAFSKEDNVLNIENLVNGEFVPRGFLGGIPLHYMNDGRFYAGNTGFSFAIAQDGRKLFQQHNPDNRGVRTIGESISPDEGIETSEFEDMTWVPHNFSAYDFNNLASKGLYKTETIKALPGIIYLYSGAPVIPDLPGLDSVPYGLSDKYTSRMILPYVRDQVGIKITYKNRTKMLEAGPFVFTDAETVPFLRKSEKIIIGNNGNNVARKVASATSFASTIPADGRILIYAPDGDNIFDSLVIRNETNELEPGSIIVFIGDRRAVFATK